MSSINNLNPCVLLHGPENSSISDIYLPVPKLEDYPPDYVLLNIAYVGVCGSDVHFYLHGGVGSDPKKYAQHYTSQGAHQATQNNEFAGLVMGHEASAKVLQVGRDVKDLKPGENVAIEPGIPCRKCAQCLGGMYNLCFGMRFAASFHEDENGVVRQTPGTLSRYYALPEQLCYRLPGHIGLDEGVLIEPLAVGVHACRLAGITNAEPGHGSGAVVVMGAGTIGLVSAAVACALGAGKVVLVDVQETRLEFAKKWLGGEGGAARRAGIKVLTYRSEGSKDAAENGRKLKESCGLDDNGGADVVLEASGVASATAMGIYVLRTNGHMVQTGLSKRPVMDAFPITDLSEKEIHLHGAFRYKHGDFLVARDLLARGLVGPVKELINEVFAFEKYEDAWKATRDGKGVKNLIRVAEE